ncbi:Phenoloxidase subunit 1 [Eumeta japonica]|uniref:Phenoloxidase subunit 1 n=1 Tax=Eumeta variegata TaxID=151549 RepID=A0A4C1U348_EUMVA|nr:Phenoloxidase subunit 1 [Eumeta japonica]
MSDRKDLLLFFDRPAEPCFMQKGDDLSVFMLPDNYYPEKYANVKTTLTNRFGSTARRAIPVANISLPDLSLPMELPYNSQFSLFVNKHREMSGRLIDIFLGSSSTISSLV